MHCSKL